jgi:putative cardiolipin synthase
MDTLGDVAARGITIIILTNSAASNNHGTVHAYYMPYRTALIQAGIKLYELQATGDLSDYLSKTGAIARAGLHTKAMVIDDDVSVIGSYNMDPRSRVWNTEIALLVFGDSIAEAVRAEMSRDFDPAAAWQVILDEKDRLIWRGKSEGEVVSLKKEPGTGWWQRFLWSLLRLLPLENEM